MKTVALLLLGLIVESVATVTVITWMLLRAHG
jgi:hypothetical protein